MAAGRDGLALGSKHPGAGPSYGHPGRRTTFVLSAVSEVSAGEYLYAIWIGKDLLNETGNRATCLKDK